MNLTIALQLQSFDRKRSRTGVRAACEQRKRAQWYHRRTIECKFHTARWRAGIILHFGGEVELAQRQRALRGVGRVDRPFENQRLQVGAGCAWGR